MSTFKLCVKSPVIDDQLRDQIEDDAVRREIIKKFFPHGEYVYLSVDTETMSVKVIEQ